MANARLYKITYYTDANIHYDSTQLITDTLPDHKKIMLILGQEMPDRPRGGWYTMETVPDVEYFGSQKEGM